MKFWIRKKQRPTEINPYPLAHALTKARQFMRPMDFFQILFDSGDFQKTVSMGFVKSYFVESIHVGIDGFPDDLTQALFEPLFAGGFNPSEDGLHYFAEWLPEAQGEQQFCDAVQALERALGLKLGGTFQALGAKYLDEELGASGRYKDLEYGCFELVADQLSPKGPSQNVG
jgi:hypothetical protein